MEITPTTVAFVLFAIWLHFILSQKFSDQEFQENLSFWINKTMGENTTHSFVYYIKKQSQATALLVSGAFTTILSNIPMFIREPKLVVFGSLFAILAASTKHYFNIPWMGFYDENISRTNTH